LSADTGAFSDCQRTSWGAGCEAAATASEINSRGRH
jgi:hypothetical protein